MKSPKPTSSGTRRPIIETTIDTDQQIRQRAYELYEQRGREDGHDLDDWLQAEAELNLQEQKATAA